MVYPTHGAGSLCSTGISSTSWSTIGYERRHDPLLAPDGDRRVRPRAAVRPADRPALLRADATDEPGRPAAARRGRARGPGRCPVDGLESALGRGALDRRCALAARHAAGHIPGSLSIPAGSSFGTWLGWVVEPDRPIVLLVEDAADLDDLSRQALRIGFEPFVGYVDGGFDAWRRAGRPVEAGGRPLRRRRSPRGSRPVARRRRSSSMSGSRPSTRPATSRARLHIGAGDLPEMLDRLPRDRPIATICASGYRTSVAASMLRAAGFEDVATVSSGVPTWEAHGFPVEYGPERRIRRLARRDRCCRRGAHALGERDPDTVEGRTRRPTLDCQCERPTESVAVDRVPVVDLEGQAAGPARRTPGPCPGRCRPGGPWPCGPGRRRRTSRRRGSPRCR